jgi:hypothetical protein
MDGEERNDELTRKLDSYLSQACEAEAAQDFEKAEHFFKYALFYEGKLRPDVSSAKQYVAEAGPVYQKTSVAAGIGDLAVHQNYENLSNVAVNITCRSYSNENSN